MDPFPPFTAHQRRPTHPQVSTRPFPELTTDVQALDFHRQHRAFSLKKTLLLKNHRGPNWTLKNSPCYWRCGKRQLITTTTSECLLLEVSAFMSHWWGYCRLTGKLDVISIKCWIWAQYYNIGNQGGNELRLSVSPLALGEKRLIVSPLESTRNDTYYSHASVFCQTFWIHTIRVAK